MLLSLLMYAHSGNLIQNIKKMNKMTKNLCCKRVLKRVKEQMYSDLRLL